MLEERAATWPQQWKTNGLREVLIELIEENFGALDSRYAELIAQASKDKLKGWLKGTFSATTAADLFEA